jgi:O-antigen/teichoic acid export membrane protein
MKTKSLGKNAFLNVIKSTLSVLFPLITYPYAFRVLHATNIGKVDYAASIVNYFSLIAMLGVSSYAIREGAKVRNDREKISRLSSEIFSINIISTIITYVLLILVLFFTNRLHDYAGLIALLSISIVFTTLGIDWINTIYEDFLFITIRSIITHIISLVLLFLLVKDEGDYYIYAFLSVLINIIVGVSNWHYCRRYISLRFTFKMNLKKHLKPILTLFANTIATSIYVNCDTTMLGWSVGDYNVGLYAMAVKIYNVLKNIMAAIYTVAIPRLSYYIGQNDLKNQKKTYTDLVGAVMLLLLPLSAGVIAIAPEIIYFMGGVEYTDSVITLQILSIGLIGAIFGGLMAYCFNIPMGRENINLKATLLSAVINVSLNIFIIPVFKQNGAALTTAISEWFVFLFCLLSAKNVDNFIDKQKILQNFRDAIMEVGMILIIAFVIHNLIKNKIISLIIIVSISCIAYLVELLITQNELFFIGLNLVQKRSNKNIFKNKM